MAIDALFLRALLPEINAWAAGARVDKIRQPGRELIILNLRGAGNRKLLICAGQDGGRIHFTDAEFENPPSPPMFCMLLRKHLSGAKIVSVRQLGVERAVQIAFMGYSALGEPEEKRLILEIMGRSANLILVSADGHIIDCLRRVDIDAQQRRPVLPGLLYRTPPAPDKLPLIDLEPGDISAAIAFAPSDKPAEKWLVERYFGLSPLIAREACHIACGDVSATVGQTREIEDAARLDAALLGIVRRVRGGEFSPCVLLDESGAARDFSFAQITQYGAAYSVRWEESASVLLDKYFTARGKADAARARASSLLKTAKNARDRARRRAANQREELCAAARRDYSRECGELIIANLHNIKPGSEELIAEDYYNGGTRKIALDPLKSPQDNAARYFKEYSKGKTAEKYLTEQIAAGEREIEYLESVLAELELAETERELEEIRLEFCETGYIRARRAGDRAKPAQPRKYISGSGAEILVGRGNKQNDLLTFKMAFKTDVWLHSKGNHGAHVILRTGGNPPRKSDILEAASIAAYYSAGRGDTRVAVDWCLAKFVKKPQGAKPGMVIYSDYKTVIAAPAHQE
ncbi:MAG: NFACT family protein [Oscillospiraceae bacterium]|jgi:predicted ribosome quality control (RQC) complex YloA/Tae2 family protein|nr:NFACT family protein [Oscillospiraceae bacterium]